MEKFPAKGIGIGYMNRSEGEMGGDSRFRILCRLIFLYVYRAGHKIIFVVSTQNDRDLRTEIYLSLTFLKCSIFS